MATFETKLSGLGTKHVLARIRHPQSNGKLERFHLEMERQSPLKTSLHPTPSGMSGPATMQSAPVGVTDPVARLVDWYNDLPHMSLVNGRETPAEAYVRKQAPKDITAEEMEGDLHARA